MSKTDINQPKRIFRIYIKAKQCKDEKIVSLNELRVFIACSVVRNRQYILEYSECWFMKTGITIIMLVKKQKYRNK